MKVLEKLRNKPICNDFHFILIGVILLLMSIKHVLCIVLLSFYLLFIYKKFKYLFRFLILILIIVFISYKYHTLNYVSYDSYEGDFLVVEEKENYYILKGDIKVYVYKRNEDIHLGDRINASLIFYKWEEKSYEEEFDYKEYYFSKDIKYRGYIKKYKDIDDGFSFSLIKYKILNFYSRYLDSRDIVYFKALLLGVDEFDKEIKNAYSFLFITHILVISGMHLAFFNKCLLWIFNNIFKIEGRLISIIILFIYILIIGIPISALRSFLFIFLSYLNDFDKVKYTKLDIYSISFISMSIINPLSCYQNGFILSYLVSFLMIFRDDIIKTDNKLIKNLLTNILAIIITLPIVINQSNYLIIGNIVIGCILGLFIGEGLLYLIILNLLCPYIKLGFIYHFLDSYLIKISNVFKGIVIPYVPFYCILIYLGLVSLIILNKYRKLCLLSLVTFIFLFLSLTGVNKNYRITFIDVGQGDSTLIELPYRRGVVLIDSFNDNVNYLKKKGIKKIDAVILTHSDIDHIGSINEVINFFKIGNVYGNPYDDYGLSICNLKKGDFINIKGLLIEVLSPSIDYKDSNMNSLVLRFNINGYEFLFMGDSTVEIENKLDVSLVDVLKVGHHGSNTSSSEAFLNKIKPKISIISVAENNKYGLPNKEVVNRLNKYSKIYMTKNNGNITVEIENKLDIKSYR